MSQKKCLDPDLNARLGKLVAQGWESSGGVGGGLRCAQTLVGQFWGSKMQIFGSKKFFFSEDVQKSPSEYLMKLKVKNLFFLGRYSIF